MVKYGGIEGDVFVSRQWNRVGRSFGQDMIIQIIHSPTQFLESEIIVKTTKAVLLKIYFRQ